MIFPFLLSKIVATFMLYLFDFEREFTRKSIFKILESLYIWIRFKYNILLKTVGKRPTEITNCQPHFFRMAELFFACNNPQQFVSLLLEHVWLPVVKWACIILEWEKNIWERNWSIFILNRQIKLSQIPFRIISNRQPSHGFWN